MENILATLYSFLYIIFVVGIAFVLFKFTKVGSEVVRKFIHILVSLWVFILTNCYTSFYWSLIGPAAFVVINAVFVNSGYAKYLGMGERKRDNGLVYFPLSILILVTMGHYELSNNEIIVASVLTMGFGDGLAALIGSKVGKHSYKFVGGKKSIEGTVTMFAVTLIVLSLFTSIPWYGVLITALVATAFENLTPLGFDNITVPLSTAITLGAFYGLY